MDDLRRDVAALLPELRAFARFLARDRNLADDIVQDAVVRALGALQQFEPGTNLKAWLFTIQRNVFYEQVRRRKREASALEERGHDDHGGPVTAHDISDLQKMIWTLPPVLREALILVGAQGMTHEEAAVICGVPVGTMKARLSRARAALNKMTEPAVLPTS